MLISKNKPEADVEKRIFNQDAPLLVAMGLLALVFQIISGFTEFLGLKEVLVPPLGDFWGKFSAGLIAFSIEYAVLYLVVYIVNAIYDGYLTSEDYTAKVRTGNRIKFGLMSGLLVGLVWLSMFLSKNNTRLVLAANPKEAKVENTDRYDQKAREKIASIERRYQSDLQKLNGTKSSSTIADRFAAEIAALSLDITNIERKEKRSGKSYRTKKTGIRKAIEQKRAEKAKELQSDDGSYNRKLEKLQSRRDEAIASVENRTNSRKEKVEKRNDKAIHDNIDLNAIISDFIVQYAQFSVLGFLVIATWVCISLNTAGIKPRVFIKPEMLEGSLVQEAWLLATTSVTRPARNWVRRKLKRIKPLETIEEGAVVSVSETDAKVISLPSPPSIPKVSGPVPLPVFIPVPMPPETDASDPVSKPVPPTETGSVSDAETGTPKQQVPTASKAETSKPKSPVSEAETNAPESATPFEATRLAPVSEAETKAETIAETNADSTTVSKIETNLSKEEIKARVKDWYRSIQSYRYKLREGIGKPETAHRNIKDRFKKICALSYQNDPETFDKYKAMFQESYGIRIIEHGDENRITFHEAAQA